MIYKIKYVNVMVRKDALESAEVTAFTPDDAVKKFEAANDGCAVVYVKEAS